MKGLPAKWRCMAMDIQNSSKKQEDGDRRMGSVLGFRNWADIYRTASSGIVYTDHFRSSVFVESRALRPTPCSIVVETL